MSATAAFLPCPICAHSGVFESVQSLRDRLIHVSTHKMLCPVCQEEVTGLDKLTIHLFSHVKIITSKTCPDKQNSKEIKNSTKNENQISQQQKQSKAKNKITSSNVISPMKYVKIYPKLPVISLNTVPIIDISRAIESESVSVPTVKTEGSLVPANTICNVCGLQFVDTDILRMHKCLIHNIDEGSSPKSFTHYQCHLCPKNFKMRGSLMVHLRVAHFGFLSGNCNSENGKETLEGNSAAPGNADKCITLERNENKQWQCDVCRKGFTTKYFLKKHKRLHTGETPYACSQCNKTFTFQQSYHKHLLYHNDEKPHTCSYCGRAFKELSTLHNHQRIHTGEKPFSCETCGKCFRQRVSYLVHRRIHTGVMPYKCTACEKSFRYKVSQRTHKCLSKPPGTVVRQTGNLLEKLKKKHIDSETTSVESVNSIHQTIQEPSFVEVSEANAELVRTGAKLSLEDMESDNFTLIAENFDYDSQNKDSETFHNISQMSGTNIVNLKNVDIVDPNLEELIDSIPSIDKNVPSPSEILKNLCLSKEEDYTRISPAPTEDKHYNLYNDFSLL